ncbi:MAG: triosephosphate isomerase [Parcubacteria group bacterium Gr01-1014_3]|nr:MAG: triosephosphate isomerase [Parcubacteria group bacterium Gr01-1014_3]
MSKLIIANWKSHPETENEAAQLAKDSDVEGLVICPPFSFLKVVAENIKTAKLGAQDMTGEAVPENLEYVIIGHSDRRKLGETDETVAEKMAQAVEDGLIPILCVGESRAERDANETEEVVGRELKIGLSLLENLKFKIENLVIAYEPIWAIGTGTPDSPESMLKMVQFIKETLNAKPYTLNPRIIYGGSVTSQNVEEFLSKEGIDGALVGGASLEAKEIIKIVEISKKY